MDADAAELEGAVLAPLFVDGNEKDGVVGLGCSAGFDWMFNLGGSATFPFRVSRIERAVGSRYFSVPGLGR